jgi:hypothetical protein
VGEADSRIRLMPPADGPEEPTVGAIKRALHELSRATSGSARHDHGAILREAHDLLRGLARHSGIDPDDVVQRRLAAIQSQRERMVLVSAASSDQASS